MKSYDPEWTRHKEKGKVEKRIKNKKEKRRKKMKKDEEFTYKVNGLNADRKMTQLNNTNKKR